MAFLSPATGFKSTTSSIKTASAKSKAAPKPKSKSPALLKASSKPGNAVKANTAKKVTAMKKIGGVYSALNR